MIGVLEQSPWSYQLLENNFTNAWITTRAHTPRGQSRLAHQHSMSKDLLRERQNFHHRQNLHSQILVCRYPVSPATTVLLCFTSVVAVSSSSPPDLDLVREPGNSCACIMKQHDTFIRKVLRDQNMVARACLTPFAEIAFRLEICGPPGRQWDSGNKQSSSAVTINKGAQDWEWRCAVLCAMTTGRRDFERCFPFVDGLGLVCSWVGLYCG